MITKEEHINFWIEQADDDWGAVEALFIAEKFPQCLFWAHLVAEKYTKAIWIKTNIENMPPKTHNISLLLSKINMEVPESIQEISLIVNRFNLEGRYPEYISKIERISNKDFAEDNLNKIKTLVSWLKKNLQ